MSKREDYKRFIVFCLASLVVLAQAAVFAWVWYSVYRGQIDEPFWRKGNWVLIAIYGLMFALFAKLYGGLKVGYLKRIDVFYSLTLALLCTNVVEYLEIPAEVHSEEYYVNMMIAWFYATALAKQWDAAVSYIEEKRLNPWTHNKTIQKARESYRITPEQKEYLKTLKV